MSLDNDSRLPDNFVTILAIAVSVPVVIIAVMLLAVVLALRKRRKNAPPVSLSDLQTGEAVNV